MDKLTACLTKMRETSGLSFHELSERAWSSPGYVHKLFKGESQPSRDFLIRLSLAFNLDVEHTDHLLRVAGFPGLVERARSQTFHPTAIPAVPEPAQI